ncbi:RCY1 [Candida theae]|uniref:RCY1 n=1 Tax=Candida theae TaxID=1198502 RepID=A0AAD5BEF9_9ASCO|nr:RCY1 [Candida theae]KAI5957798.1 RCY1 [Candida theae]
MGLLKDFQTPEDQAKMLTNLLSYNKVDHFEETRGLAHDKLSDLFEQFENTLLRELEIHFDVEDYEQTRRFVTILMSLNNQQTLIDFFLQKTIFDEDMEMFGLTPLGMDDYFADSQIDASMFDKLIANIASVFNKQSEIIDKIFPQSIPMMYKVCEEIISNQLSELVLFVLDSSKKYNLYLNIVPFLYDKLTTDLIERMVSSENVGESYHKLVRELIDMMFESFAVEYMREEVAQFRLNAQEKLIKWNEQISQREAETSSKILESVKVESKNDFLTSFKSVFALSSSKDPASKANFTEMQAKAKILSENIRSLNKILSPEVVLEIINNATNSLNRLMTFKDFTIASLRSDIFSSTQEIFIDVMDTIGIEHLTPGFEKALTYLQTYNPNSPTYTTQHNEKFAEPIVLFFDLINMADVIIQMVDFFYKEEMLNKKVVKHENSILNPSLQSKKKLEALVDKNVADGLNVGIELLVHQIETTYQELLLDTDYNPPSDAVTTLGPTTAAQKATSILEENMNLLVDSADKSVVDVFQQEIAERFFQVIVKMLKRRTVSVTGATNLISDLNLYYEFMLENIMSNKRQIMPLYQALKKIGNLYLIGGDDSKAIGKLVSDLSKFNGIFGQEEIYEFVQRREDWPLIKKHVEKVMRCFTTKLPLPVYDTAFSRIEHLSKLKSTYDIVKELKDTYSSINATFIQDLISAVPESNKENAALPFNVLRNEKVKEYLLKDCCEIVMKDDPKLILGSLGILHRAKILPKYKYQSQDANGLRMEFLHLLMDGNHVSLSTMCILNFIHNGIDVPYSTIRLFIDIISSSSLRNFSMNAYCLLQILQTSPRIDTSELFTSLMFLSSNSNGNYFANHLLFKYAGDDKFRNMPSFQQHQVLLSMLQLNLENSDAIKALQIWQLAKPIVLANVPSANQVSSYVEKVVTAFQLHHDPHLIEEELANLPSCIDTDYMVDFKLFFYAQYSAEKFNVLTKALRSPLRRTSLTSLLKSFIQLRDETNAEKIMETIFAHSTINSAELNTIVEKLLQQSKVSEAASTMRRMSLEITKASYLSMFKYTWMNKDQVFFKELYLKFMKLKRDDPTLESFTISLIEAISSINNRQAIRYYTKFLKMVSFQNSKTNQLYQQVDFKRYGLLDEFSQLICLTPFGMVECLKVLSKEAINNRDDISLRWCIEEFRKSGWDVRTVIEYLEYFDNQGYLKEVLKARAFN